MGYFRMKNKHNMYINYERSYKKRRHSGKNKLLIILFIIILAIGLGLATYYIIEAQLNSKNNVGEQTNIKGLEGELDSEQLQTQPVIQATQQPTPTIVARVTLQPTPTIVASVVAVNEPLETKDTRIPTKVKGVYVTSRVASSNLIDKLVELVDTTEVNAMVIDIKDDQGKITYAMDSDMAQEIGAVTNTITDVETLVSTLKEKGIYLIARIVAFKDPYLAEQRQELAIKNQDGSLYRDNNDECWVNPYNHDVWDYLLEVATQAATVGFNEIQFDYIRFSTGGKISEADFGEDAKTKNKQEVITEFTKYVYEKLKPLGVFVSADVYGTIISSSIDAGLVGQDYVEMSKYLDYICPMIYPSHYGEGNYGIKYPDLEPFNLIRKVMTASKTKLDQIPAGEHRAIVRPWLQDFTASWIKHHMKYGGPELREQIKGVYSAGYEEWLLWNASCNYSEDGLQQE